MIKTYLNPYAVWHVELCRTQPTGRSGLRSHDKLGPQPLGPRAGRAADKCDRSFASGSFASLHLLQTSFFRPRQLPCLIIGEVPLIRGNIMKDYILCWEPPIWMNFVNLMFIKPLYKWYILWEDSWEIQPSIKSSLYQVLKIEEKTPTSTV